MQASSKACLGQVGCLACPGVRIDAQGYTELLHHERVEYAWMINVESQDILGSVEIHQVSNSVWCHVIDIHLMATSTSFAGARN